MRRADVAAEVAGRAMRSRMPGLLLATVLLILLLLSSYQLRLSYENQLHAADSASRNLASIFETRLDVTLQRTDADLISLAHEIPVAALNQKTVPFYEREINGKLDGRMLNVDEMGGYRVFDADGDTLYLSDSSTTPRVNIADRDYFKRLRADPMRGLVFSEVVNGRGVGRQVLVVARALHDGGGKFLGVVLGMIELEYYRKQFRSLDLGTNGFIVLRRLDNHAQVVRIPEAVIGVNRPLPPEHPLAQGISAVDRSLNLHYVDPDDGEARILGVQVMQDYPFYFAVGFSRSDVLAGWRVQVVVVGLSTLLLFALLTTLIRRLGRMRVREAGILDNLAQSETQFAELAQLVPVGIAHFDAAGRYTFVNRRHRLLTGRSNEESIGRPWYDFIHPDDRKKLEGIWDGSVRPRQAFVCEYRFIRSDGEIVYVIGEVRAEIDVNNNVTGYIVAQTDITQRKRAEAELLVAKQEADTANLAKTRFLAAASHDLRQPIQAISLFRDALGRTGLTEEQKTICNFLSMSVHSLGELLYSLLDISKLEAGLVVPQVEKVLIETLITAIDAEFSPLAQQKGLRFKLSYPLKDMTLITDPRLLMSVVRNLIDNAIKYTETGGVLVGARRRSGRIVIQVWDTGIGIEQQYGDQVFDECFQVGNAVRDRSKGLGIGLSIARRTARLLGGEVSYRSRAGVGSLFEIVLPASNVRLPGHVGHLQAEAMPALPPQIEASPRLHGWRVVVIEDDPVVGKSMEISLQTLGVTTEVHLSAEAALESPLILGADFYISDFNLPGMDGIEFLDALQRRAAAPLDAVLMTGEASQERIEATAASRWNVLFKPVGLGRLLALMNEVVERRARL